MSLSSFSLTRSICEIVLLLSDDETVSLLSMEYCPLSWMTKRVLVVACHSGKAAIPYRLGHQRLASVQDEDLFFQLPGLFELVN